MLDYDLLMKEVSNIKNCYFIYSYDAKLVKNFLESIEKKLILRDLKQFNYINMKFDNSFDINYFFECCDTIPMMQDKKVIVIENSLFLRNDYDNKEFISKLKEYLGNLPSYCIIVFYYVFENKDKNKDNLKIFSKFGQVCNIQELKGDNFYREVSKIFLSNKVNISKNLIIYFCSIIVNDFFYIENEIKKLKFFVDEREVTRKDIDDIIPKSLENNVFVLINNVLDKNLNKSMVSFRELILSGNDFNYIFSMLSNQFSKFLDVKLLLEEGFSFEDIMKKTRINQYSLNNFIKLSKKYSLKNIMDVIDAFLDLEYKIRISTDVDPLLEFEILLISVCR
ncbi:DNA polymerase III, delta subunit [Candidatus Arthromitus sp. SFB-mouse-Japan]|uniref:DNA polymerase III subunit delta n=1 Tax=Candidatus Arthromitus sp. SFB-mouse TaxID=49118 RepID=UPI00021B7FC5|nr:DNA polymerase III subunit delta [Candidatus Arthromitus sp. SFB-mouse]EIA21876.1 DNA polymerase III, delta subunit [Candidatus Arthromitus sp. SFB-3]EIA27956.1 DNA polymerase III, delta subunit [Candidatus Arthromitus sp. SFB-4]EIA28011.1 DNA polymerase III, delta subunit [Candidatus Arthromitus sp. SFB-co]EIA30984.1 DNA polymerase III, delta subunit [Candidatus Arthromitus sp. SFB-mouse-SU]EGX28606.1 DNA-directed DNA polymerase III delta subunit [Candidatus Arthromitus sp. SFB-mouse-NYU]